MAMTKRMNSVQLKVSVVVICGIFLFWALLSSSASTKWELQSPESVTAQPLKGK